MRSILHKYFFFFSACFLITLILFNTYAVNKIEDSITEKKERALYEEVNLICDNYGYKYYSNEITANDLQEQLICVDSFLGTDTWLVNVDGNVLFKNGQLTNSDLNIYNFDEDILSYSTKTNVTLDNYLQEPMLMATGRILANYTTAGYLIMFYPMSKINESTLLISNVINTCIIFFIFIFLLFGLFFYFFNVRPLQKLITAAKEYGNGHYDYTFELNSSDEYKELASAIQFMASELSSLDDYQKNFVANISHDFRSPLTSIKGYVEAILDGTIPPEMQNKYLDIILFETNRLNKLTNNLLTLNSYERNGAMLHLVIFDINSVIKKTVTTFEGICTKKKITIKLDFYAKEQFVKADDDKIQQVLYNLIDNAIKFSQPNSNIQITTSVKSDKVFISVKDYGIGISKDNLNKIWDRFYKSDTSRGKDKKGTGLGLSITKEIINQHKENINVVSTEGVGTEFIFTLPYISTYESEL